MPFKICIKYLYLGQVKTLTSESFNEDGHSVCVLGFVPLK